MHRLRETWLRICSRRASTWAAWSLFLTGMACTSDHNAVVDVPTLQLGDLEQRVLADGEGINHVCGLHDGTLVFLESQRPALGFLRDDRLDRVGRSGRGPGEFERPTAAVCFDSRRVLVTEPGRRAHVFSADGVFLRTERLPRGPLSAPLIAVVGHANSGRLYYLESGLETHVPSPGAARAPDDSVNVWAFALGDSTAQVIERLGGIRALTVPAGTGTLTLRAPFENRDIFVPLPDGGHAVVRGQLGVIERQDTEGRSETSLGWLRRQPVTAAAQDSVDAHWQTHPNPAFRGVRIPLPAEYPLVLDAAADPRDQLWLHIPGGQYIVVSSEGKPLARITLHAGSRLAGFDLHAVYTLREGELGTELYRVVLPELLLGNTR